MAEAGGEGGHAVQLKVCIEAALEDGSALLDPYFRFNFCQETKVLTSPVGGEGWVKVHLNSDGDEIDPADLAAAESSSPRAATTEDGGEGTDAGPLDETKVCPPFLSL